MLIKACNDITSICDDKEINTENFMDSLNYISNLYKFVDAIKETLTNNSTKIKFLPSFKGVYVSQRLGIPSTEEENQMRIFKIKSALFLEDKSIIEKLKKDVNNICYEMIIDKDIITFKLK